MSEKPCGAYFFAFFENFFVPILTSGGLAAVSSSGFAALCSAFGRYDVVHIHAEGPAFFAWLPKLLGKRVVVTIHGIDWQREKWQSGLDFPSFHHIYNQGLDQISNALFWHQTTEKQYVGVFFQPELICNQTCFPNLRPIHTIRDKMRFSSISFLKIVLHSFAQNNDLVCVLHSVFFALVDKLRAKAYLSGDSAKLCVMARLLTVIKKKS